jgi:hypothetical protein
MLTRLPLLLLLLLLLQLPQLLLRRHNSAFGDWRSRLQILKRS